MPEPRTWSLPVIPSEVTAVRGASGTVYRRSGTLWAKPGVTVRLYTLGELLASGWPLTEVTEEEGGNG